MEVAGIVIGGAGLVALFDKCIDAFECIDSGRKYGKEYQEAALKISALHLRLAHWKDTVHIVDDSSEFSNSNVRVASQVEANVVQDSLESIQARFKDIEIVAQDHVVVTTQPTDGLPSIEILTSRFEKLALVRQKRSSLKQKAKWAIRDKNKLNGLANSLRDSINDLIALFPESKGQIASSAKEDARQLVEPAEVEEADNDQELPVILQHATEGVCPELRSALDEVVRDMKGHSFGRATIRDSAKVHDGDYYSETYRGPGGQGGSHQYGDMDASGNSKIHRGNNRGGPYVLDG